MREGAIRGGEARYIHVDGTETEPGAECLVVPCGCHEWRILYGGTKLEQEAAEKKYGPAIRSILDQAAQLAKPAETWKAPEGVAPVASYIHRGGLRTPLGVTCIYPGCGCIALKERIDEEREAERIDGVVDEEGFGVKYDPGHPEEIRRGLPPIPTPFSDAVARKAPPGMQEEFDRQQREQFSIGVDLAQPKGERTVVMRRDKDGVLFDESEARLQAAIWAREYRSRKDLYLPLADKPWTPEERAAFEEAWKKRQPPPAPKRSWFRRMLAWLLSDVTE